MCVYCRNCFAVALAATLIAGCGKPVPPPTVQTTPQPTVAETPAPVTSPSPSPGVAETPSPLVGTTAEPTTQPGAQQEDMATRLERIEQLLATAAESSLFAEPEVLVSIEGNRLGPGPNPVPDAGAENRLVPNPVAPGPGSAPVRPAPAATDYKVVPVADGGTIAGLISFDGKPRAPKVIKVEKTPEVCGKEDRELYEVTVNDGKLQDVVLLLEGVKEGKPFDNHVLLGPPPGARLAEDTGENQAFPGTDIKPQKCIFGAFTGVIAQGSVLRFDNLDPVKHSPHTYGVKGRVRKSMHNQDLEGKGKLELPIKLKKGYKVVKLECDQHPHMQNWFRAVDNPYYDFSAADGTFAIDQVPPGTYNLIAWHPILGEFEKEVNVVAGGTVDVSFEFSSKRRG